MIRITAPEDWGHVGCPACGYVYMVPLRETETPPWCTHTGSYSWRAPHPETQAGPRAWAQMVRVEVRALSNHDPCRSTSVDTKPLSARYELDCVECSFDTYGGEDYLALGYEHVEETGHAVRVKVIQWGTLSRAPSTSRVEEGS